MKKRTLQSIRRMYRAGGVKGVLNALHEGWREGGGSREFLRCVRHDWSIWLGVVFALVIQDFWVLVIFAVMAALGGSLREWQLRHLTKIIEGYGTMVDEQQGIIHGYQNPHEHESEKAARARLN